jgi:hypothetical protein
MDQQLASYPLMSHHLKRYKNCLFDMMLLSAYILYAKTTSQKLKYNQFRLVVAQELMDGLVMPEHERQVCLAADTPTRLQAAH